MQTMRNLTTPVASNTSPVVLTVGNFDGVHLGHQTVIKKAKNLAVERGVNCAVLTFENHPATVLRPTQPIPLICTLPHKIHLLEQLTIDQLLLLPFTQEFSQLSAEQFLQLVSVTLPFSHLVLGHDATLGKDRQGTRKHIEKLAHQLHFTVDYLPPYAFEGEVVSSSAIRTAIQRGDLTQAGCLLGRPYSIYGQVMSGHATGRQLGFPTANLDVSQLCLPPLGVYAVQVKHGNRQLSGVANLGTAPTMRREGMLLLEVHLLDHDRPLYDEYIEVFFRRYIRSEQKFSSVDALRAQIENDVSVVRKMKNF